MIDRNFKITGMKEREKRAFDVVIRLLLALSILSSCTTGALLVLSRLEAKELQTHTWIPNYRLSGHEELLGGSGYFDVTRNLFCGINVGSSRIDSCYTTYDSESVVTTITTTGCTATAEESTYFYLDSPIGNTTGISVPRHTVFDVPTVISGILTKTMLTYANVNTDEIKPLEPLWGSVFTEDIKVDCPARFAP